MVCVCVCVRRRACIHKCIHCAFKKVWPGFEHLGTRVSGDGMDQCLMSVCVCVYACVLCRQDWKTVVKIKKLLAIP